MSVYYYFLIGVIFTLFIDLTSDLLNSPVRFNFLERILCIIIWPLTTFVFILAAIKEIIKK
jgi:hypothetical protein|tara:strand:+ start:169 stop:351 length:183 start_codon:yes stop_codon:yes gene_type:complete